MSEQILKKRLAIVTTHPVQYYAPLFQRLSQHGIIEIMVFYTWGKGSIHKYDPGFNKTFSWDLPLLEGYPHVWEENTSSKPGSHHFRGIVNPHLISNLSSWKPDVILVYGWAYESHLSCIRHFRNRIPIFFRGDSTLLDQQPVLRQITRTWLLRWVYRKLTLALYAGKNNKAYFARHGLQEEQLLHLPHAVDNKRFAADRTTAVQTLRKQLNIPDAHIVVLFAGKFEPKKAPLKLLEAFLQLQDAAHVHLLFAGNGSLKEALTGMAGPHPNIHFIDFQNQLDMPVVYQTADLFCLPSEGPGETWGLAVNEAMACGKAILVSDKVGSAADLVVEGYNGYIVKSTSEGDLTTQLRLMLGMGKERLLEMGAASQKIIRGWSFEQQSAILEKAVINYG